MRLRILSFFVCSGAALGFKGRLTSFDSMFGVGNRATISPVIRNVEGVLLLGMVLSRVALVGATPWLRHKKHVVEAHHELLTTVSQLEARLQEKEAQLQEKEADSPTKSEQGTKASWLFEIIAADVLFSPCEPFGSCEPLRGTPTTLLKGFIKLTGGDVDGVRRMTDRPVRKVARDKTSTFADAFHSRFADDLPNAFLRFVDRIKGVQHVLEIEILNVKYETGELHIGFKELYAKEQDYMSLAERAAARVALASTFTCEDCALLAYPSIMIDNWLTDFVDTVETAVGLDPEVVDEVNTVAKAGAKLVVEGVESAVKFLEANACMITVTAAFLPHSCHPSSHLPCDTSPIISSPPDCRRLHHRGWHGPRSHVGWRGRGHRCGD
jgi:hypothetical protein